MIGSCVRAPASTKLVSWNVRGFRPRAQEVDNLFTDPSVDVLFVCETMQGRYTDGTIAPLDFTGTKISMPGIKDRGAPGHPSMGVAFLSKTEKLTRIASLQGVNNNWQMLVIDTDRLRFIGIYAKPRMPRADCIIMLKHLDNHRAATRPTITCGDFNAHYRLWTPGASDAAGEALRHHVHLDAASSTPQRAARAADFSLHAPSDPTFRSKNARGRLVESTIDLFLTARVAADRLSPASLHLPLTSGGSDHAPVTITVSHPLPIDTAPSIQFCPTPRRLADPELLKAATSWYSTNLSPYPHRFDECATPDQLANAYNSLIEAIKQPWLTKTRRKPARFRQGWTRQADRVARERGRAQRRLYKTVKTQEEKQAAWKEVNRMTKIIQRLVKQHRHSTRDDTQVRLRKAAESRSIADVAAVVRRSVREANESEYKGVCLDPSDFTKYFAAKPRPPEHVPLRHFDLSPLVKHELDTSIRRAKRGKAPGPDGIPMEVYKIDSALFANVFYHMFKACGRLAAVVPGWDLSVLIPIHKKGPVALPENHRPLRLIPTVKRLYGMVVERMLGREAQNDPYQYGFQHRICAIMLLATVVADLRNPGITTVAADQKGAYDTVNRQKLMKLVDRRHTPAVANLVPMLLQPGTVYTEGDITKLLRVIDVGLTQGGPDSPALFNIVDDELLKAIRLAVAQTLPPDEPQPAKAFADDLLLQFRDLLNAKRALAACGRWANKSDQAFNLKRGKSAHLTHGIEAPDPDLRINGGLILGQEEFDYLGISISATGPTDSSLARRLRAASASFATLHRNNIFVRGMTLSVARMVYDTFVVAKWSYAVFFVPFSDISRRAADSLDAALISATVVKCRTNTSRGRRPTLPQLRAVLRIPSPGLRRQTAAHAFAARINTLIADENLPAHIRAKARDTRAALWKIPSFLQLVSDPCKPWNTNDVREARVAEWTRASAGLARPVPSPSRDTQYYPPAMRLKPHWARNLAARYHISTFPILHRQAQRAGPRRKNGRALAPLQERAVLTDAETDAMKTLKLLHRADTPPHKLPAIVDALKTLRPRDKWARTAKKPAY